MNSPFKFLDSYTKDDRDIFFGRNREIEELYQQVFESKLLLVYGVSGSGKSSLINCGLANKFQETDWLPFEIRRGNNIIESMASAVKKASITKQPGEIITGSQFRKSVRSLYLDNYKPIFFIFDQFEELFIFGSKDEKKDFIQVIKALMDSDIQCRFIFVMREEYMAGITEFERYLPTIFANRVRIEKMPHLNAMEAINGPCKVVNINLEDNFSETLLEKISPESEDVELTYLQVYLDKIFRLAQSEKTNGSSEILFTLSLIQKIGNVSDILGSFLDEQISLLDDPATALTILKAFVSIKGTRKQMNPEEVTEFALTLGKQITGSVLQEIIQKFIQLRILRDKDQNGRYELRHDTLAIKIYEKITLVEKEILEIHQLIENAFNSWQKRGVLLSADDLKYIGPYESHLYLSKEFSAFIEKSKKELIRVKRRRRNFATVAAMVLLLILSGFTWWALLERNKAIAESKHSKVLLLLAKARETSVNDPTMAIRYAQLAYKYDSTNVLASQTIFEIYHAADSAPFYTSTFSHNESVFSAIFSPDSKTILTASDNKTAKLWDLSGKCLAIFSGHISYLYSAIFSPDGKTVLTSSVDKTAKLWDLSGKCLTTFTGHTDRVVNAVFAPDGKTVLTASRDKTSKLWDLSGNCLITFSGHTDRVLDALFSPDGKNIVTASRDNTARRWDLSGKCLTVFSGHTDYVWSAVFSPDGKYILTGSWDNSAKLWALSGKCLATFSGHKDRIYSAVFSPDSKTILTSSYDKTAKLWDISGKCLTTFHGHKDWIYPAVFSPDGKTVLTASFDRTAKLWDLSGKCIATFTGHKSDVNSAAFSPDNKYILTCSFDRTAKLWDLSQKYLTTFTGHTDRVSLAVFSNNGKNILTSSADKTAKLWDLSGKCLATCLGHKDYVYSALFSRDDKFIITASDDKTAKLWDLSGKCLTTFSGHLEYVYYAIFSTDGKTIITASKDKTAKIWDLSGKCLTTLSGHTDLVSSVVFSTDGKTILTASSDKKAKIWDLSGKCLATCSGHTDNIYWAFFSPDNKFIITCSKDKTARMWDSSGKCLAIYSGHSDYVYSAVFSPDGKSVLTSSSDKTAKLWDLKGKCLATLIGHTDRVYTAVFSPDGKTILTASYDKTAKLWDLSGKCLCTLTGHMSSIYYAFFSPDGKKVLTSSYDKTSKLWLTPSAIFNWLNVSKTGSLSPEYKTEISELDDFTKLCQSEDLSMITEYAKWYLSTQDTTKAEFLYERSLHLNPLSVDKKILGDIYKKQNRKDKYSALYKDEPDAIIKDEISALPDTSAVTNYRMKFNYYSEKAKLYERLLTLKPDEQNRYYAASNYYYMGWYGILSDRYSEALIATLRGIELYQANEVLIRNLPVCYLFDGQIEKAESVYSEYKDKPYTDDTQYTTFKEAFLADIEDFKSKGIINPGFEKMKNLLKK